MTINERINNIKEYFVTFNVHEGISYVLTKFPKKWSLFNKEDIEKEFNVKIEPRDEGIYFLTEIQNGFDCLFDAIDYIVVNNKSLEEKTSLLESKIRELSEVFMREPLERLKTLEFTFPKKSCGKSKKNVVKIETKEEVVDNIPDVEQPTATNVVLPTDCQVEESSNPELLVQDKQKTEKKNKKNKVKQEVEDSDLLDFAKTLTD